MDSESLLMQASVLELIDRRVRWLRRRLGGPMNDLDDIEQELRLVLIQRATEFREGQTNLEAFTYNVLHGKGCKLIRQQLAKKRRSVLRCEQRLPLDPCDTYTLLRAGSTAPPQAVLELQLDVRETIKRMPDSLRQIAEALMQSSDYTSAAKSLGISRRTILRAKSELARWLSRSREYV